MTIYINLIQRHPAINQRLLRTATQAQIGIQHARGFLPLHQRRIDHRQRDIGDIDVAADNASYLRIGNLYVTVKLAIIGQLDQPVGLRTTVGQAGIKVQPIKGDRQRVALHLLNHLHAVTHQGNFCVRQRTSRFPAYVRPPGEHAAQSGLRTEERFYHRQIKAVQHHAGLATRAGFDGFRHAQFGVRVLPAVRSNTDFLRGVQVIQRNGASQSPFAHRSIETGIVQVAAPALLLAIETALQRQLTGYRLAVNFQLQLMLLLTAFGIQCQQADIQRILLKLLNAYRQLTLDLVAGTHVAVNLHPVDAQRLPLQAGSGQVGQQLRRLQVAPQFQQAFRRTAQPWQSAVQTWRVDIRIQVPAFLVQLALNVQLVASQRQIDARDFPLTGSIAAKRATCGDFVLLHVTIELQHRHLQLPTAAVQAATGGDFPFQTRWPFRPLLGGINA
ncbi:hypothetical protein D3C72_1005500 [compost metagenome]